MNLMRPSLQHLLRYTDEGEDMLNMILTGDESWLRHYQSEPKRASVQWKLPSSPTAKSLSYAVSLEGDGYHVLGFSESTSISLSGTR
jgi:hypothetical protein